MIRKELDKEAVRAAVDWKDVISTLGGVDRAILDRRTEGPCPKCGGDTRFRYFEDGSGGAICSHCFREKNSDGFSTLGWLLDKPMPQSFPEMLKLVAQHCGIEPQANGNGKPLGITERVSRRKGMPVDAMLAYGAKPATRNGKECVRFPMYGPDGKQCSHFDVFDSDEKGKSASKADAKEKYASTHAGTPGVMLPHEDGTPRLPQPEEKWCSAEGVKDSSAAYGIGYPCIGFPTCKLPNAFARLVDGVHLVHIADRDEAGDTGAKRTGALVYGQAVEYKITVLPMEWKETKGADLRDALKEVGEDAVRQAIADAKPWTPEPLPPLDDGGDVPKLVLPSGRTDVANAKRFVNRYRDTVLWVDEWQKWLVWDGTRWAVDKRRQVDGFAKEVSRRLWQELVELSEAGTVLDEKEATAISGFVRSSNGDRALKAMVNQARSDVAEVAESFDTNEWLLNCPNGTLNLQTGKLYQHRHEDRITKSCPTKYNPRATCQMWERFIDEIFLGNGELIQFVQRMMGYCLTGSTREQVMFICHGGGENGKSTFMDTSTQVIGDAYAINSAPDLLMAKKGAHPTELADLAGKRLVSCMETDEDKKLAEGLVKRLTGEHKQKGRRMREDFWEFVQTHKLFILCNHKPQIRGSDHAIWRRIRLVPFDYTVPEEKKDDKLLDKLQDEAEGILLWMVQGCREWQEHGLGKCEAVSAATAQYRREEDVLSEFFEKCCIEVDDERHVPCTKLYQEFMAYTDSDMNQRRFVAEMAKRGYSEDNRKRRKITFGPLRGKWGYFGIGLLDDRNEDDQEAGGCGEF